MSKREARRWEKELKKKPWLANPHQVYLANGLAYVVARDGDTFRLLGGEFDISWKKLVDYNDLHKEYTIEAGDIIYLKKKTRRRRNLIRSTSCATASPCTPLPRSTASG